MGSLDAVRFDVALGRASFAGEAWDFVRIFDFAATAVGMGVLVSGSEMTDRRADGR